MGYYDDYDLFGNGPCDSEEAFEMGLRPARCNGCRLAQYRHELGDKFLLVGTTVYELDAEPEPGQERTSWRGRPVKFHCWFVSLAHSDECYHWTPPTMETEDGEEAHTDKDC